MIRGTTILRSGQGSTLLGQLGQLKTAIVVKLSVFAPTIQQGFGVD